MHQYYKLAMAQQRAVALTAWADPDIVVDHSQSWLAGFAIVRPRRYRAHSHK